LFFETLKENLLSITKISRIVTHIRYGEIPEACTGVSVLAGLSGSGEITHEVNSKRINKKFV